jgi:membrane fusion protein, multidrug efflux system
MTDSATTRRRGARKVILFCLLIGAGVAGATALVWRVPNAQETQVPQQNVSPGVPVGVAPAQRQDVPVYLTGLGTVQAFYAVTVRPRVDGTLMRYAVTEGQELKQNDLIAVIDPRPYQAALDAAGAKKAQDEAQLANAKRDLVRYASLAKQDFASRQQVDTQQASVDQFTAAIKGDEAAIETAQLNLSFCYVLSPIDGRVGLRQVDPGNLVHANDPAGIISIAQLRPISVVFTLPQDSLSAILEAMKTRKLTVSAFSSDDNRELDHGELLTPDNAIDQGTGTIKLKATLPNPDNRLWPGQFVEARLLLDTLRNVLAVPTRAVQHGPDGLYVYIVKPDSTVARRDVVVDHRNGDKSVIGKGLAEGDRVVVSGQSRLQEGTRVAIQGAEAEGRERPDVPGTSGG